MGKEQLRMVRDNSPVYLPDAPEGYFMRSFEKGDEEDWCRCCIDGDLGITEISVPQFERFMLEDDAVAPQNIYFLVHKTGEVAGTATHMFGKQPGEAIVHMVGITGKHQGKGLARYLNLYVIDKMIAGGVRSISLKTDDWRLPAIKTYLNCGFLPLITEPSMLQRWHDVAEKLGVEIKDRVIQEQ